jgi:hypothetical protein
VENLDAMNGGVVGVFIASPTKSGRWEAVCHMAHRTVRCATGHCPVRQPRHPTVRVRPLELLSSGPPDSHCALSGAPSDAALTLARTVAHSMRLQMTVDAEVVVAPLAHRTVRCSTGQSGEF